MPESSLIYLNGDFLPHADAKVHVLSPAMRYGALVFEGICAYWNDIKLQSYIFRSREHVLRLQDSMRLMRFEQDFSADMLGDIVRETVARNNLKRDVHIRLSAWIDGEGGMASAGPVSLMCAAVPRGERTLDSRAVKATISNWRRIDDRAMPPRIKSAANYANSRLALMQAHADGYDEAILLGPDGKVSEAAAACIFMVRNGRAVTPPVTSGILESVTRATLLDLLADRLGMPVDVRPVDRTELYVAQEVFLCGSSYEVTPVISVDRISVAAGEIGPVTRKLWDEYEGLVRGQADTNSNFLTPVFSG
jgi:branched-chain amino acid aminotransferase